MAVTTIINTKENKSSNILIYALGVVGIGLVVFFGGQVIENLDKLKGKAGISVEVVNNPAQILIDNQKVGDVTYTSKDLKPGTKVITLKSDTRQYQTSLNFISAEKGVIPMVGIVRDLGTSDYFSSGQEFWFEKDTSGDTLRLISDPQGATVSIDGSDIGKTPFSSNSISSGTYQIKISREGHETQTASIAITKGYTLNGNIKLFPTPIPAQPPALPDSTNLYNLSVDNPATVSDTQAWAKAIFYWENTRGVNFPNDGITNKGKLFDLFLDYKGNFFNSDGDLITKAEELANLASVKKIGYLGQVADGQTISKEAKDALTGTSFKLAGKSVKVKATPTGWLRVRDTASLGGIEIAKVNTGTQYTYLEESAGWVKIKVSETLSGWVSSDYVEILQ